MATKIVHDIFVTVDTAVFTVKDNELLVLLVKRRKDAECFANTWSLPGGIIREKEDESADETAKKKLHSKTGIELKFLEQLKTYTGSTRDPRGWSVSIAYFILMPYLDCLNDTGEVEEARWVVVSKLEAFGRLAFDHDKILADAIKRLREKTLYTLLPAYCLGETFTLNELHSAFESILGPEVKIQKKSLYRRIDASNALKDTGETYDTRSKKAALYSVTSETHRYTFDRNLAGRTS